MRYYAGVGSRTAPPNILQWMTAFAKSMALNKDDDWWLRSGAAKGADQAFETGAGKKADIYLPWVGFEGRQTGKLLRPTKLAYRIASEHHPVWFRLGLGVRSLLARDVHQILGDDCQSPSEFVVCWTPDGAVTAAETTILTGGTGMAIRIANTYQIPVWNLKNTLTQPENIPNF